MGATEDLAAQEEDCGGGIGEENIGQADEQPGAVTEDGDGAYPGLNGTA